MSRFSTDDVKVTIGDCSTWVNRIASWLVFSLLAWWILFFGEQDVTGLASVKTRKSNARLDRPEGAKETP
jgi:hypothetical protein